VLRVGAFRKSRLLSSEHNRSMLDAFVADLCAPHEAAATGSRAAAAAAAATSAAAAAQAAVGVLRLPLDQLKARL
jgi:hypothetical protein